MVIAYKILVMIYLFFGIWGKKEYNKQLGGKIANDTPLMIVGQIVGLVGIISLFVNWGDFNSQNVFQINKVSLICICLIFIHSYIKFFGLTVYDILFTTRHKILFFVRFYIIGLTIIYLSFKFGN